jgi:tocopherol O-methyltransferase
VEPREAVEAYYRQTWWDYRFLWSNSRNLALHFGQYDETARTHSAALENANRVLARIAGVRRGDWVLDAGCGVGGSSLWLARQLGASVVGIALGGDQTARAARAARAHGFERRVRFLRADFTSIPLRSETFDVVWALESVCHAADKAAFYREASRVLRPGGRIVVADFMRRSGAPEEDGGRLLQQWIAGWAMAGLDTAAEHCRNAHDAGLVGARVDDATLRTLPSLRRLYRMARFCFPMAALARRLGIRSGIQHANVVASIRQYEALKRGQWMYGILAARKPEDGTR